MTVRLVFTSHKVFTSHNCGVSRNERALDTMPHGLLLRLEVGIGFSCFQLDRCRRRTWLMIGDWSEAVGGVNDSGRMSGSLSREGGGWAAWIKTQRRQGRGTFGARPGGCVGLECRCMWNKVADEGALGSWKTLSASPGRRGSSSG